MDITINKTPSKEELNALNVFDWPIWEKEASEFPWYYDNKETCYIIEGQVIVTPENGDPIEINEGNLVTFPRGLSCTWKITKDLRKHYNFG